MDQERIRELARTTFIYVIIGGVIVWATYFQPIVIPREQAIRLLGLDSILSTSTLFLPGLSLLFFSYFSRLVKIMFLGELMTHLRKGLIKFGIAFTAWLLVKNWYIPDVWSSLGFVLILLTGLLTISQIGKIYLKEHNRPLLLLVSSTLTILAVGFLILQAWDIFHGYVDSTQILSLDVLAEMIEEKTILGNFYNIVFNKMNIVLLLSFIFTSLIPLTKIIRNQDNHYVSYVGKKLDSNPVAVFFRLLLFFSYAFFLRGYLLSLARLNGKYLALAEWVVVCFASFSTFRRVKSYVSKSLLGLDIQGYWAKHQQVIEYFGDEKLENISNKVSGFLTSGEGEELAIYLAEILTAYKIPIDDTIKAIKSLISYQDKKEKMITFSWHRKNIEEENRKNRMEILEMTLENVHELGRIMRYRSIRTRARDADQYVEKAEEITV